MATITGNTRRDFAVAVDAGGHRRKIFLVGRVHVRARNGENKSCGSGFSCRRRRPNARVHFASDGFTGHQKGLIGQTASTGVAPSQPASRRALRPYSGAERLEGPGGVRAEFGGDAQLAEHFLRFDVARDHQRIAAVALAHFLQQRIHRARLCPVMRRSACSARKRCPASRSSSS